MPNDKVSDDSWFAWSKHVLMQLEEYSKCIHQIKRDVTDIKVEIAKLKIKASIWGAIGGEIPVVVAIGIWILKDSK